MNGDYEVLWYGNGGVGVVSKVYPDCQSRDLAIEQFVADQGERAREMLIGVYKVESDNVTCAKCLGLANEIRQLKNEVSDLRGAIDCYLDRLSQINTLSSFSSGAGK